MGLMYFDRYKTFRILLLLNYISSYKYIVASSSLLNSETNENISTANEITSEIENNNLLIKLG